MKMITTIHDIPEGERGKKSGAGNGSRAAAQLPKTTVASGVGASG